MRAMLGVISEGLKDVMVMLCELIRTKESEIRAVNGHEGNYSVRSKGRVESWEA